MRVEPSFQQFEFLLKGAFLVKVRQQLS